MRHRPLPRLRLLSLLALSSGCIIEPFDGQTVADPDAAVFFSGYWTSPNATIDVECYSAASAAWLPVTTTTSIGADPWSVVQWAGLDWYSWSVSTPIPASCWEPGNLSGERAIVRSSSTDGQAYTMNGPFFDCWSIEMTLDEAIDQCTTSHGVVELRTDDYAHALTPHLDLTTPVETSTMFGMNPAALDILVGAGSYRLARLSRSSDPWTSFDAVLVENDGPFATVADEFDYGLTAADLYAYGPTHARRITDIAAYYEGGLRRYAVATAPNDLRRRTSVLLEATSIAEVEAHAAAIDARVIDLEVDRTNWIGERFSAVLLQNVDGDRPVQSFGYGTAGQLSLLTSPALVPAQGPGPDVRQRVIAARPRHDEDPACALNPDGCPQSYYYVTEDSSEHAWWYPRLQEHDDQIPTGDLDHVTQRLGGRVIDLHRSGPDADDTFAVSLLDTGPVSRSLTINLNYGRFSGMEDAIRAVMKKHALPGLNLAIVHDGALVYARGFGQQVVGGPTTHPMTRFRIASVSKVLTAIAVHRLIQDGQLELGTHPFVDLFMGPNIDPKLDNITVEQLLGHTSGLTGWTMTPLEAKAMNPNVGDPVDNDAFWKADTGVSLSPGSQWHYANSNYHMLAHVVEAVDGRDLATYVDEVLLQPLGIDRIAPSSLADIASGVEATSYLPIGTPNNWFDVDGLNAGQGYLTPLESRLGATAFAASPVDFLRLLTSVTGDYGGVRVLDDISLDRMLTPQPQFGGQGLGPRLVNCDVMTGDCDFRHGGWLPGSAGAEFIVRQDGWMVAYMHTGDAPDKWSSGVKHAEMTAAIYDNLPTDPGVLSLLMDHWDWYGF